MVAEYREKRLLAFQNAVGVPFAVNLGKVAALNITEVDAAIQSIMIIEVLNGSLQTVEASMDI